MRNALLHVNGIPQPQGYAAAENPVGDPNEVHPSYEWQARYALTASRFGPAPSQPTHETDR